MQLRLDASRSAAAASGKPALRSARRSLMLARQRLGLARAHVRAAGGAGVDTSRAVFALDVAAGELDKLVDDGGHDDE